LASGTRARKKPKSAQPKRWWLRIALTVIAIGAIGFAGVAIAIAMTDVPSPNEVATSEATIVYYADGKNEVGRLGEATRRSIELEAMPTEAQYAVLAAEDRTFYTHGGISPIGIARAAWNNIRGESTQGGSTITQQYAKNAFLTQDRSWNRKIKEALLAFKLETIISKDDILEDYLNTIYFGRGAYGIEAASIAYFGIPASELTPSQSAVLAAVIKSPSALSPESNRDALKGRWAYVMDAMVDEGWITPRQRKQAQFPEVIESKAANRLGGQVGYLLGAVRDELISQGYDETEIERGGLRIISTYDRRAQRAAVAAVRKAGPKENTEGLRIGLAAVRPGTGEVVAMYGGKDFVTNQINNATRPFAQAGSTFKTYALAAAMDNGIPLSSVWNGNSPATVKGYTFRNYGNRSYGDVTLLQATENSINSAYVEMEDSVGVEKVADAALRAGIPVTTPGLNLDELNLTFVLGTASPSALDVANSYATFAASGTQAKPVFIKQVIGPNGGLLYQHQAETTVAFGAPTADAVSYALNRAVTNGTGKTALALGRPAAGKTGTTDGNKSAWFSGYTPQLSAAVLFAKEDAQGMPVSLSGTGGLATVTGGSFPAAIWTEFMKAALAKEPVIEFPDPPRSLTAQLVCPTEWPTDGTPIPRGCPEPELDAEFDPIPIEDDAPDDEPPAPDDEYDPANPDGEPALPPDEFAPEP
jgi:membrane peptidoglycan carboxypeptidase